MSISNFAETNILDEIFNAGAGTMPAADLYMQLHTGDPNETGASNIANVARVQVAFNAASGNSVTNTSNIDFTSMPAATIYGWSFLDTSGGGPPPSGGNCYWWGVLSIKSGLCIVTGAGASTDDITWEGHGLSADDRIIFELAEADAHPQILPAAADYYGTGTGVCYYVLSAGLTTDTFRISLTSGGAAINVTGGAAIGRVVTPKTTNSGDTFRIAAGDLDIYLD